MIFTQDQLDEIVSLAKGCGATRLILFGSFLDGPDTAEDIDLACNGVSKNIFRLACSIEEVIKKPADLVELTPSTRFTRMIERRGKCLYDVADKKRVLLCELFDDNQQSKITLADLHEEISIMLELMGNTVQQALFEFNQMNQMDTKITNRNTASSALSFEERTILASSSYLLNQFCRSIENILKRFHRYHGVILPGGDSFHTELLRRFCNPSHPPFPVLFNESLAADFSKLLEIRNIKYTSQLDIIKIGSSHKSVQSSWHG